MNILGIIGFVVIFVLFFVIGGALEARKERKKAIGRFYRALVSE